MLYFGDEQTVAQKCATIRKDGAMKAKKALTVVMISMGVVLAAGCGRYEAKLPKECEDARIFVEKIDGISDDFLRGVDISTVISEEENGAKYYTEDGIEEDVFKILADSGVNSVRVRVWNDPFDKDGNGYGGGNCDVENAVKIAKRAKKYGMSMVIDFHYSDFWADPSKQMCPKAWEGMTPAEKSDAAYSFTYDALEKIIKAGGDVKFVQIGNETNTGIAGETIWKSIAEVMNGGSRAVRKIGDRMKKDIKVCVHFTNPEDSWNIDGIAGKLQRYEVDYDVFCLSYYPYWHGTRENLAKVMENLRSKYEKEAMVVETSYMFTEEDGDGNANSVSAKDLCAEYAATIQSQANAVRDVCETVSNAGGLGVYYWEPAWIPVDSSTWEKGTGWATGFAAEYDPDDAGVYYGGCAWDNQAMFDFDGKALPSLSVFKYLKYGAKAETGIDFMEDVFVNSIMNENIELPEKVMTFYNDRSLNGETAVSWDEETIAGIDTSVPGTYEIGGTLPEGSKITARVNIEGVNILSNPGFEDNDHSMWKITEKNSATVDYQRKEGDAHSGEWALHFWNAGDVEFTAEQTLSNLENGTYTVYCYAQGGDNGKSPKMFLYANSSGNEYTDDFLTDGWINWMKPAIYGIEVTDNTLTFGVNVKAGAGAWGTFDDFCVYKEK